MKITLFTAGAHAKEYQPQLKAYQERLRRFQTVSWRIIDAPSTIGEQAKLRAVLPEHYIALDETGKNIKTTDISSELERLRLIGQDLNLVIGGADGLGEEILKAADEKWAFGAITLPHQLVRLIAIEQLYRAATILANHPYHRP